jgi:hypothetical protein
MTYKRDGPTWDWTCKRFNGKDMDPWGFALTYRAAVRRSRRAASLADRKVTVKYK